MHTGIWHLASTSSLCGFWFLGSGFWFASAPGLGPRTTGAAGGWEERYERRRRPARHVRTHTQGGRSVVPGARCQVSF